MDAKNIQFTKIEIMLLIYLFKHYKNKYNARQLARALNINHAHASKLCTLSAAKGLLIKEQIGNSIYFSYNYEDNAALDFMRYLLSREEKDFPKWLAVIFHNLKKFSPYIKLGLIFGSSINNREFNDVDIFLMYENKKSSEVSRIKEEIRKAQLIAKPIRYIEMAEKDILLNKEDKVFYGLMSDNLIFHNPAKYMEIIKKCRK